MADSRRSVTGEGHVPAARVTDMIVSTATQGAPVPIIPPGTPTVLIGGLPAAALGDSCGADTIIKGSATVLIGGNARGARHRLHGRRRHRDAPRCADRPDRRVTWRLVNSRDDRAFLGRGWSFPPTFDRKAGGVQMLEHEADIVSSLHILLSTAPRRADHGPAVRLQHGRARLREPRHADETLMADKIESAILYHEPRIDLERVHARRQPDATLEGVVLIGVIYRVKSTNSRFNFVFPYYRRRRHRHQPDHHGPAPSGRAMSDGRRDCSQNTDPLKLVREGTSQDGRVLRTRSIRPTAPVNARARRRTASCLRKAMPRLLKYFDANNYRHRRLGAFFGGRRLRAARRRRDRGRRGLQGEHAVLVRLSEQSRTTEVNTADAAQRPSRLSVREPSARWRWRWTGSRKACRTRNRRSKARCRISSRPSLRRPSSG